MSIRVGPQSQNWSDQQNTLDPTGSVHKKARGKKFDPKKRPYFSHLGGTRNGTSGARIKNCKTTFQYKLAPKTPKKTP